MLRADVLKRPAGEIAGPASSFAYLFERPFAPVRQPPRSSVYRRHWLIGAIAASSPFVFSHRLVLRAAFPCFDALPHVAEPLVGSISGHREQFVVAVGLLAAHY